jgi:AcrR family transcriptional regulator
MVTLNEPDPRSGIKKPTRERILDAALAAFGAHGPMGARVDEIAASAGVNKRMLYHHFGDKAGLFRAALEERVLARLGAPDKGRDLAWLDSMPAEAWRMLVWASQPSEPWPFASLVAALEGRQQAGELRDDVSAQLMALCLLGAHAIPELFGAVPHLTDARQVSAELAGMFVTSRQRPRVRIKPAIQRRQDSG